MKRTVSSILLVMLLASMLYSAFNILPVKAAGTIYIRADGSIDPITANITSADNLTYTFADNIFDSIVVERSYIIIDGNGFMLQGSGGGNGFGLSNVARVTITNTSIIGFWHGIYLQDSLRIVLSRNNITHNYRGVWIYQCSDISLYENNIASNDEQGVTFFYSSHNVFRNNSLSGPRAFDIGSLLGWSSSTTPSNYFHDIDESNTINGKPVCYLVNRTDMEVPSTAGFVVLVNCQNMTVRGTLLENNSVGMLLRNVRNSIVVDNTIANSVYGGVYFHESSDNILSGNNLVNNSYGVNLFRSSHNKISENAVIENIEGIRIYDSPNNEVSMNNITHSQNGILQEIHYGNFFYGNTIVNNTQHGIYLADSYSTGSVVLGNRIIDSMGNGITAHGSNNIIVENVIMNSNAGVVLGGYPDPSNNKVFHNNFIGYRYRSYSSSPSPNAWDNGYPSGGNYWSDYMYPDSLSGPNQDQPGGDGVGDIPIIMNPNNIDRFPLIAPFSIFDAGTWNGTTYNVDIVSNSTLSDFYFNPEEGAFVRFWVKGETVTETVGFCRVAIPKNLLWVEDGWTVLYGSSYLDYKTFSDEDYTYLYSTYANPLLNNFTTVTIIGTHVIPELPSFLILSSSIFTTLLATSVYKRKKKAFPLFSRRYKRRLALRDY